jgi:hypothetical protein
MSPWQYKQWCEYWSEIKSSSVDFSSLEEEEKEDEDEYIDCVVQLIAIIVGVILCIIYHCFKIYV